MRYKGYRLHQTILFSHSFKNVNPSFDCLVSLRRIDCDEGYFSDVVVDTSRQFFSVIVLPIPVDVNASFASGTITVHFLSSAVEYFEIHPIHKARAFRLIRYTTAFIQTSFSRQSVAALITVCAENIITLISIWREDVW